MADIPAPANNTNQPTSNNKKTGNRNFFRARNRFYATGPRQNTVSVPIPQTISTETVGGAYQPSVGPSTSSISFRIDKKSGPYSGWKLYFPEIGILI